MAPLDELTAESALAILSGRVELSPRATARLLGGGVSNVVALVEDGLQRIVLKQSLPRLRVRDRWLADRERIAREWEVMQALGELLPKGRLPQLLFRDEERFLYAMRAAPDESVDWKTELLAGTCDRATARRAGATLGLIIRSTWEHRALGARFSDRTAFDQLRTDPYYRTVASRHPRLAGLVEDWIAASSRRQVAMVHGDWSPKNLLVTADRLVCIDFECAHFGDPSYDAGFLLNHLILKAFRRPELAPSYLSLARTAMAWTLGMLPAGGLEWFEASALRHLGFLMLARVDGKSPVEYLTTDADRNAVRRFALDLIRAPPTSVDEACGRVRIALGSDPSTGLPESP